MNQYYTGSDLYPALGLTMHLLKEEKSANPTEACRTCELRPQPYPNHSCDICQKQY